MKKMVLCKFVFSPGVVRNTAEQPTAFHLGFAANLMTAETWTMKAQERARAGVEPMVAAPTKPECPGVSRSDHSAS